jgi:hypothetical protein
MRRSLVPPISFGTVDLREATVGRFRTYRAHFSDGRIFCGGQVSTQVARAAQRIKTVTYARVLSMSLSLNNLDYLNRRDRMPSEGMRYTRRLTDKILIAFHSACDQNDIDAAGPLLDVLDFMVRRASVDRRSRDHRTEESVFAAHERLWHLKNREHTDG